MPYSIYIQLKEWIDSGGDINTLCYPMYYWACAILDGEIPPF